MLTTKSILKAINNPNLSLYPGIGYWYFTYGEGSRFETHSIYTMRLSDLPKERWVAEGLDFCKSMESDEKAQTS